MKKVLLTIIVIVTSWHYSMLICQSVSEVNDDKLASISGKVLSSDAKKPIKNISINLLIKEVDTGIYRISKFTTTDKKGDYKFIGLKPGIYSVRIDPFVYEGKVYPEQSSHDIIIESGAYIDNTNIYIPIGPLGCIKGNVINSETSQPIQIAQLELFKEDNDKLEWITIEFSNSEGEYIFRRIEEGEYTIKVRAEGYSPTKKENISLREDEQISNLDFALSAARGEIKGTITNGEENISKGIDIRIVSSDWEYTYEVTTDLNGEYAIKGIADNTYYIFVTQDGSPKAYEKIRISGNGIQEVNFKLNVVP